VGCARQCQLLALNHDAVALATAPHSQPCLTVQAIDALVIGVRAFAFHQGVQSAVAESTTFVRQLHQTRREHRNTDAPPSRG
ncbi:hypothetical protein VT71_19765, partial [Burkholderia mallei]